MTTRLDELFKAAGEPTRLRILNLLRMGSICVCDLQATLGLPQPTVSRHLAVLRHAGLVEDSRDGTRVMYSLARQTSPFVAGFLETLAVCCARDPTLVNELKAVRRKVSNTRRETHPEPPAPGNENVPSD
jgi:ArsR family transcriptional regulator